MAVVEQSSKFFVRLYVGGGKRRWIPEPFDTREEAEAYEASLRRGSEETWDAFAERWLREYPPAKDSTLTTYTHALNRFSEDFKGVRVGTALEKAPWAIGRGVEGNDRQVARAWALENPHRRPVVRNMMNAALNEGLLERNPFADLRLPESRGRKEIVALSADEVELLSSAARSLRPESAPLIEGAILTLGYAGLRVSELFALRWSDIDLQEQAAVIRRRAYHGRMDTPKSGRSREIVLPERAVDGIQMAPRRLGQELVFPSPQGKVFRAFTFGRYWEICRARFEADLTQERREDLARYRPPSHNGVTVHELRHAAATWMLDQGASVEMVAQQLGHSSTKITELYGHPNQRAMRERLRAVVAPRPVTSLSEVKEARSQHG